MQLEIKLLSDTAFGRGEGSAGQVDVEVDYDPQTGLPFIHARRLKGLLVESCSEILYALNPVETDDHNQYPPSPYEDEALYLFGIPGSTLSTQAKMTIYDATFSSNFIASVKASKFSVADVLASWTSIHSSTAASTLGVPDKGSLRSIRVIKQDATFYAPIDFMDEPSYETIQLLNMIAQNTRRAGLGRNRGWGHIQVQLIADDGQSVPNEFATLLQTNGGAS